MSFYLKAKIINLSVLEFAPVAQLINELGINGVQHDLNLEQAQV